MQTDVEGLTLTSGEREMARQHWDAIMFAFSRADLERARRALMDAPFPIQQSVITDINANWLREYEPERNENPFLAPVAFSSLAPGKGEETSEELSSEPIETFHVDPVDDFSTSSGGSLPSHSLSSYAHRFVEGITQLSLPRIGGRICFHQPVASIGKSSRR